MTDEIRPYGPGKFDTILDAYVYDVSMDGAEEECGSIDENGMWYGLMRHGHTIFKDGDPSLEELNPAERDLLMHCAGVIVSENAHGFVSIEYFDMAEELDAAWAEIEQEIGGAAMSTHYIPTLKLFEPCRADAHLDCAEESAGVKCSCDCHYPIGSQEPYSPDVNY